MWGVGAAMMALTLLVLAFAAQPGLAAGGHGSGGGGGGHAGIARGGMGGTGGAHSGGHVGASPRYGFVGRGPVGHGRFGGARGSGVPRGVGHGRGYRWGGGYWGGYWWPPVVFGADFLGFLPVLPAYCPVYWWNDVPYYYYNSAYYTWDSAEDGYVASEPPPAAAVYSSDDGAGDAGSGVPNTHTGPIDSGNLYAYPENGQTQQQQLQDRDECERWAASQSGSSADHPGGPDTVPASSSIDYRRALSACLTGRGYSVD